MWLFSLYKTNLGCGIRPVVTNSDDIIYLIKTVTDHGKIEVIESSPGGE